MSDAPIKTYEGENGVRVEVYDLSSPYGYRNIFHLRLSVVARFKDMTETFERTIEKMGVFEEELEKTKGELLTSFEETGLPYLFRHDFPAKFCDSLAKDKGKACGYGK